MSNYLHNLATRLFNQAETIQPRLASRFELMPGISGAATLHDQEAPGEASVFTESPLPRHAAEQQPVPASTRSLQPAVPLIRPPAETREPDLQTVAATLRQSAPLQARTKIEPTVGSQTQPARNPAITAETRALPSQAHVEPQQHSVRKDPLPSSPIGLESPILTAQPAGYSPAETREPDLQTVASTLRQSAPLQARTKIEPVAGSETPPVRHSAITEEVHTLPSVPPIVPELAVERFVTPSKIRPSLEAHGAPPTKPGNANGQPPTAPSITPAAPARTEPSAPEPAPVIRVTIGRIEVRAIQQLPPPVPREAPRTPTLSLDDYLRRRQGGQQ